MVQLVDQFTHLRLVVLFLALNSCKYIGESLWKTLSLKFLSLVNLLLGTGMECIVNMIPDIGKQ